MAVDVVAAQTTQLDVVGEGMVATAAADKGNDAAFQNAPPSAVVISRPLSAAMQPPSASVVARPPLGKTPANKDVARKVNFEAKPMQSRESKVTKVSVREVSRKGASADPSSVGPATVNEGKGSAKDDAGGKSEEGRKRKKGGENGDGSQKKRKTMADFARQRDEPSKKTAPVASTAIVAEVSQTSSLPTPSLPSTSSSSSFLSSLPTPSPSPSPSPSSTPASTPTRPSNYKPSVRVVNGNIVIEDHSSLVMPLRAAEHSDYSIVNEHKARITCRSFANYSPNEKWSVEDTDLFYEGLQQCGTDFTLLQRLFPHKTRRQIRNKYKREEEADPSRVLCALRERRPIEVERFAPLVEEGKEGEEGEGEGRKE